MEEADDQGGVPFLDTRCTPQNDGSIQIQVYRKPTHTDLYLQWSSNHPLSAKLSVARSLFHRSKTVCSNPEIKNREDNHVRHVLKCNGYPPWAIQRTWEKVNSPSQNSGSSLQVVSNNVKSKGYMVTPYVPVLSEKLRDTLKPKGIQVYFKGSNTLRSKLMAPKDKDPKAKKQGVIYDVKCNIPSCKSRYIGETGRTLEERYREHTKSTNSALKLHEDAYGHPLSSDADCDNIRIIDREDNYNKRKILEAIYIKANDPDLNRNIGKSDIPNIYDKLILSKEGGFVVD